MAPIHMNELREIIHRLRRGEGVRTVARNMSLARGTVRKYRDLACSNDLLDPKVPLPDQETLGRLMGPPPAPRHMRSTVEHYGEKVAALVKNNVAMTTIWRRLCEDCGYTGSYSSVRRYVNGLRPRQPEAVCRVETPPGKEAQVDFGFGGLVRDAAAGRNRRVWVFIMTLSWSRHQYVECVFDQKIETWLGCHERAFDWFGGFPERVVIDNLKSAVLDATLHDQVLGEAYRRLAQHYGFLISPNRPRTPRHKGKVERGVAYVKSSFLAGREFTSLDEMNAAVRRWVMETAGTRDHGTTHEAPLKRFRETEVAALLPLPQDPFDLVASYRPKVHRDGYVVVDRRYYSVPARLVGEHVEVYVGRRMVEIFHGLELVATHPVGSQPGSRQTRMEDLPEHKRAFLENPPERCRERAARVGPKTSELVNTLLDERPLDRLPSVQALLRLAEREGPARVEAACGRALHFSAPSYRKVKTILAARLESEPLEPPLVAVEAPPQACRYARPPDAFFQRETTPGGGEAAS